MKFYDCCSADDVLLWVARVNDGEREVVGTEINPVTFFANSTAEFTCFCL